MKVLSLFDGISGCQLALNRLGIPIDEYYASEIDTYAMTITQVRFPKTIQLGDVSKIDFTQFKDIDLLAGGSPCQDLSITNHNRKCLEGERSGLFYKYVEALDTIKPKYFLLENVASMPDSSRDAITELMGVEPIMIDSALVCSQQRKRYYWTNLPVEQPEDRHVCVEDIIDYSYLEPCSRVDYVMKPDLTERSDKMERLGQFGKGGQGLRIYSTKGKGNCLGTGGANNEKYLIHSPKGDIIRQLTTLECERQQTLPDYYTRVPGVPDRERRKAIGNGWTIDVIAHIFKSLKGEENGIRAVERQT